MIRDGIVQRLSFVEDPGMYVPNLRSRAVLVATWLAPSLALAGTLPARFTLGQYVPEHAWLYIHAVANPERAWIEQQWADVFDALKNSGIDRDITSLVMSALTDEDRAKAEETIQRVTTLIRGVNWGDLARHEFVFAEGFPPSSHVTYGYVLLFRSAENTAQGNISGLVEILKAVDGMSEQIKLVESKRNDVDLWSLRMGLNEKGEAAFVVDLLRRGDIIGLVADAPMGEHCSGPSHTLEAVLGLMAGQSGKKSILTHARFQDAMGLVKPPQDALTYFDMKLCIDGFGSMFTKLSDKIAAKKPKIEGNAKEGAPKAPADAQAKTPPAGEDDEELLGLALLQKALSLANVFDYVITTVETQGRRELTHVASRLQSGKQTSPLSSALVSRKPFDRFDQFIPVDATGFSLDASIDLGILYKMVRDFVVAEIPQGKEGIAHLDAKLAEIGFDPQRDIFDWLSGEMISVDMPAAVVTPMGGADSVTMIRVKNPELASKKVNGAIDFLSSTMQKKGQMLMVTPAKVDAEGFREITHPMIAMFVRPVVGIHGDWLTIGTSAAAVNKCLAVASGKAPSIRENKRFKEEGLIPTGPVASFSFKDTSNFGQELAGVAGMIGMFGGMVTASIPDEPDTQQVKKIVQSALAIVLKLGPILQKIDFYSSESSMTTYDGSLTTRTESVVTYKDPSSDKAPATAKAPTPPPAPQPPKPPRP